MKRRSFITLAAAATALNTTAAPKKKTFIHHVYFWLANPTSEQDKAQLIAGLKKLSKVPAIKQVHIGLPADTRRDVIDSSYQVSWCLFFDSPADQEVYQKHPIHLKFVDENKHLWSKLTVYDAVDL